MSSDTPQKSPGSPQLLSAALTEAQVIIDAAEKRAQELRDAAIKAHEESRKKGYEEGLIQGRRDAARTAIRLIEESVVLDERLTEAAAKLALAICSTVIGEAVRVEPTLVLKITERALKQSIVGDAVKIFVNPEDRSALDNTLGELGRIAAGARITIENDPSLSRGGCIIKTEFGEVDGSIELLLDEVSIRLGVRS